MYLLIAMALCCALFAQPALAQEAAPATTADEQAAPEAAPAENGPLVGDAGALVPVYVDEAAEDLGGDVATAAADFSIADTLMGLVQDSGLYALFQGNWKNAVMIGISCVLLYLAIVKKFEPMLLLTIAFGMLLVNLPLGGLMSPPPEGESWTKAGLLYLFSQGVKSSIFPCLIFMGVGAMTDFGPMLANPMSLLLGAAAQLGIYVAFVLAIVMGHTIPGIDFTPQQAAAIAIIGGADGPTAIFLATKLASELLAPIAVAAYSYMALIPLIQPPSCGC